MKLLITLLALASPVCATRLEIKTTENGERRLLVRGAEDEHESQAAVMENKFRKLGQKLDHCFVVTYIAFVEDILQYSVPTEHGTSYWFPVYDPITFNAVGTFTEESSETHEKECISKGAFAFEYDMESQSYDSGINVASTCMSSYSSVTGGTGKFACATGYQEFAEYTDQSKFIKTNLFLCDTPCLPKTSSNFPGNNVGRDVELGYEQEIESELDYYTDLYYDDE